MAKNIITLSRDPTVGVHFTQRTKPCVTLAESVKYPTTLCETLRTLCRGVLAARKNGWMR